MCRRTNQRRSFRKRRDLFAVPLNWSISLLCFFSLSPTLSADFEPFCILPLLNPFSAYFLAGSDRACGLMCVTAG